MSSRAVCVRCGGERADFDQICPSCGHRPEGEGLLPFVKVSNSATMARAVLAAQGYATFQ